jgi:hypothetical protein
LLLHIDPDERRLVGQISTGSNGQGVTYATPDGRFLIWPRSRDLFTPHTVTGLDRLTGALLPDLMIGNSFGPVGHLARVEAYDFDMEGHLVALTPAGIRRLASPGCTPTPGFPMSVRGNHLLLVCSGMPAAVMVYDLARETTVLQRPRGTWWPPALSPDGTALYLFEDSPQLLRKYAVDSGAVLAERTLPASGAMQVDPFTGWVVIAAGAGNQAATVVLDPKTLDVLLVLPAKWGTLWEFDPERPRAFAISSSQNANRDWLSRINVIDTTTFTIEASIDLPAGLRPLSVTLVPRPSPPVSLGAVVVGSSVELYWTAPHRGLATQYRIEVGSAPSLRDLAVFDVAPRMVVVHGVPEGRYFVRVRGVNADGAGLPSNEIVVDVGDRQPQAR